MEDMTAKEDFQKDYSSNDYKGDLAGKSDSDNQADVKAEFNTSNEGKISEESRNSLSNENKTWALFRFIK